MKKHERIQGNWIIFAVLASILFFGPLQDFFKIIKYIAKKPYLKNLSHIQTRRGRPR